MPSLVYGKKRVKINRLEEVKIAMHVLWWRSLGAPGLGYYHHAIVVEIDTVRRTVTVVELTVNSKALLQFSSQSSSGLKVLGR